MSAALARGDLDTSCPLHAGIDIGSKTVKLVLQDDAGEIAYASYDRHLSNVKETVLYVLRRAERYCPDGAFSVGVTGSAGMRLAEIPGVPSSRRLWRAAALWTGSFPTPTSPSRSAGRIRRSSSSPAARSCA